jgi:hypothetical protein
MPLWAASIDAHTGLNTRRRKELNRGLAALPLTKLSSQPGRNGEELATDEASVWKRVLNYRVAAFRRPDSILETHPGQFVSTAIYRSARPSAHIFDHLDMITESSLDLIDIDPFGQPWDTITRVLPFIANDTVVFVSNGEAHAVRRNLKRAQRYPTTYFGRNMPRWITTEYLPRLTEMIGLPCRFFYAFPTTVRSVHSRGLLPNGLFNGCPQWMWWLAKYAQT